jgi:hypothetical protein
MRKYLITIDDKNARPIIVEEKKDDEDMKIVGVNTNNSVIKNSNYQQNSEAKVTPVNLFKATERTSSIFTPGVSNQEDSKKINAKKDKLVQNISEINKNYQAQQGMTFNGVTVPKVEEKVYEMPTADQIEKTVTAEKSPAYEIEKEKLVEEKNQVEKSLKTELDEVEEAVKQSIGQLRAKYSQAKENTSNQALKRGLGRSSIVLNQLQELEKGEISSLEDVIKRGEESRQEVNDEIRTLTQNLTTAIRGLDQKKAAEIAKGIRELTAEHQKKSDAVLEYNNKMKNEQAKIIADLIKDGVSVDEKSSDEYVNMIADKVKAFYSYYSDMGEQASAEIQKDKDFIVNELGVNGFNNLLRQFN